jgi:alkanesulfonate monooxygenase SsuD/methylene tetrahydromethanopterin reductase-like flavin-dependent oxidoreductase (luciferase family)
MAPPVRLGINLWSQASDWPGFIRAAERADGLGYDHLWTWDHLYAIFGDPHQPIFEGYTALAALAQATRRARLGLFVTANTFRNPALATKCLVTIDHISGGRAIMGIGAAWFEAEHRAYGVDFGRSPGQRLGWLAEAVPAVRDLLDGREVSSAEGGRYQFDRLSMRPLPLQEHVPLMVGGSGERKTLRIVAQHADMWNAFGTPDVLEHKDRVLRDHCAEVGRDHREIERSVGCKVTIRQSEAEAERVRRALLEHNRTPLVSVEGDDTFWTGSPERIAETMAAYLRIGFGTFIVELPAPYDVETMQTMIEVVKPMIEGAPVRT